MKKSLLTVALAALFVANVFAQSKFYEKFTFTKADTLRGMLTKERACYDVTYYKLDIAVDIQRQFIKGFVDIQFDIVEEFDVMQIDLFKNMEINEIVFYDQPLTFNRLDNAVFVHFPFKLGTGKNAKLRVYYQGFPQKADNPPWDGGFVWKKDNQVRPWIGVACEGDGASLWWPNKDHLSDEPDSMSISVAIPNELTCVSNGNLRSTEPYYPGITKWNWFVSYPINNYNVSINIGHYDHFSDKYIASDGDTLDLDYYVLDYNLEKAKTHFEQVKPMLGCYEKYFGKYPFWNDGFAMVETPYLGMEHQSGIAYGNNYQRGYAGGMIPRDMNWDFIIIHESGHEYFGNSVSTKDHCDMWIHESFTTYMEALYVECLYSYEDAIRYLEGQKSFIRNLEPMVGPRDVNFDNWSGSDHYFKGSWMLHTFRHVISDDEKWFAFLKGYYNKFKFTTTTTDDFLAFVNDFFQKDYSKFFEQYLKYPNMPRLGYKLKQKGDDLKVSYTWIANVEGFDMPVKVGKKGDYQMIYPIAGEMKEMVFKNLNKADFQIATELFYVKKANL